MAAMSVPSMSPATKAWLATVLRHVKAIVAATEKWIETEGS